RAGYLRQSEAFAVGATVADAIHFADELEAHERIAGGEAAFADFELVENLWDLHERINIVFERLGIAHLTTQRLVSELSGGELTRVRLAGLLLAEPDFLLLDEPTNHLDLSAREFVYNFVASWNKGLVAVSHDRRLLSYVDQIAELHPREVRIYGGNFDFYRQQREVEKEAAEQTLLCAKLKLKEAQAVARQAVERQSKRTSAAGKSAIKRGLPTIAIGAKKRQAEKSSARIKAVHEMKIERVREEVTAARQRVEPSREITIDLESSEVPAHKRMIEISEVNYRYEEAARPLWPNPLSFEIVGPERVQVKGPNGSGKSTLIDLICGRKTPSTGEVRVGTRRIGLLDQKTGILDESSTVFENLRRVAPLRPAHELRIILGRFLFEQEAALKPVPALSGGERMRAALACLLGADQSPQILMIDEPTNNLDLASVEELVSALKAYRGVLIAVSHDDTFLEEIGIERVIEL
ncbi:MAG TPA: ABC-F family ATP-binding cassette domain-containing protein, partial [Blastocatellia bacterium]|nr:ABC-F family ATP-binding cassette domain-containing protein [Blastocatellia bacterium]